MVGNTGWETPGEWKRQRGQRILLRCVQLRVVHPVASPSSHLDDSATEPCGSSLAFRRQGIISTSHNFLQECQSFSTSLTQEFHLRESWTFSFLPHPSSSFITKSHFAHKEADIAVSQGQPCPGPEKEPHKCVLFPSTQESTRKCHA